MPLHEAFLLVIDTWRNWKLSQGKEISHCEEERERLTVENDGTPPEGKTSYQFFGNIRDHLLDQNGELDRLGAVAAILCPQ